ncbi:P-loop containing nucleoside triphosphate hydrolase protein [Mollisia scopiformis]|uniref:p-loop containing nucleoside triphosphate hydrolase protein n=1 Tax=Mollisia scopiformis TaxID=149040 RepID=A0A194WUC0_MOLSC|nr:P-loop containing nucleoside triphosphate hydrolase protein [Mollisia scopiformis]KUJ11269.1 P-loop containing nucleoside triphosphate hydrolase protein [Mollisia scopiformis]
MEEDDYEDDEDDDEPDQSARNFSFLGSSLDEATHPSGVNCEIKLYEARYNHKGERPRLQVGKYHRKQPELHQDHNSALVFTRWYNYDSEVETTELVIRSLHLKKALSKVIKEYPGINFKTQNIILGDLPKCLFHYRKELEAYGETLPADSDAFEHLELLLEHMWQQLQVPYASYSNLMESTVIKPGLDFSDLWMAFKPGDLLYLKAMGCHRVVQLKTMILAGSRSFWKVYFVYIADDGRRVGYIKNECRIEKYDGYRPLVNLEIFPLQYHPDQAGVKKHTIARGQNMMALRGVKYRMYDGLIRAFELQKRRTVVGDSDVLPLPATMTKARVVIDAQTFAKKNQYSMPFTDETLGRLPKYAESDEYFLYDEQLMICDHEVAGFSLAEKRWCWFDVDNIFEVEFNLTAFERLLLPQEQKDMIYSLVEVHTNSNLVFDDVIKGKGKGMVFLLHGVPGVGKTLTAESVADQTKRPLYTISSGELGVGTKAVEDNLKAALDLATTWNAIVLLDEADVFLEQRSMQDLDRNSLVSIFLRLMEYYEGILILTTNRIEAFDRAFKSRIHLAIKYHALSPAYRVNLWHAFITSTIDADRTSSDKLKNTYPWLTDTYLNEIGREDLNGRQIKNTVRTANALAVSAKVPLSPKHIETALKAMRMFESDFAESHHEAEEPSNKRRRVG